MDVYSLLTEDVRYTVPTVTLLSACSESDVRRLALERLQESANHLSVEVMVRDTVLFKVERDAAVPGAATQRIATPSE